MNDSFCGSSKSNDPQKELKRFLQFKNMNTIKPTLWEKSAYSQIWFTTKKKGNIIVFITEKDEIIYTFSHKSNTFGQKHNLNDLW